jgi:hypothetical protein
LVGGSRGSTSSTASMGALVLEGLGGLTREAVKSVGAGASELMLHFPNTAKKVPQNRPRYLDWAGKCSKLIPELIPELGPSALVHLSGHPVPGIARQSGEIWHFCIPYGIPGSVEPCPKPLCIGLQRLIVFSSYWWIFHILGLLLTSDRWKHCKVY